MKTRDEEPSKLIEALKALQPARVGKGLEQQAPERAFARRARVVALDLGADALDQSVVLDAGRTRGDARHAAEAAIEMGHHLLGDLGGAVQPLVDEHDSPARRVGLLGPEHVRGARIEAEAAVNAVVDELLLRRAVGVEGGHVTKMPGLQTPVGSKRALTRRMS